MENDALFAACCVKYSPSLSEPIIKWLIGIDTFTSTTEYREFKEKTYHSESNSVCNMITFKSSRQYHGKKLVCFVADYPSINASKELNVTYSPSVELLTITSSDETYPDEFWENQTVATECQADGNPSPLVTLERKAMNRTGWQICSYDFVTSIDNNKYIWKFILPNVTRNESGEYRCKATNFVGQYSVSKPGTLDVKYPATVKMVTEPTVYIERGGNVTVVCETDSNPSPEVTLYTTVQGHWVELPTQSGKHVADGYLSR
ncbi:Myelin-associated glycoprotein [Holothuria leucospilota]|uniref:Myelin-associated glycoprotein n=1 Tax=Holothuria leucospilota TaxID=206669 RepID=A0A9Q1H4K1_HOLLE|nr:Myelin-associated glycoprotein [Holothuria leucospilota]